MGLLENRLDSYLKDINPKTAGRVTGGVEWIWLPLTVVFRKLHLLKRRWNPGFCGFWNCHKSHLFWKEKFFRPSKRLEEFHWNSSSRLEGMKKFPVSISYFHQISSSFWIFWPFRVTKKLMMSTSTCNRWCRHCFNFNIL